MNTTTGTDIAIPARADLAVMFCAEKGLDPLIARIAEEVRSHAPDVSTKRGRDAIAALAYKVARSKTALDDAGKSLNEEARTQINAVDAARRTLREQLDALKAEARAPLDAWEAAETARVDAIKDGLARFDDGRVDYMSDPALIQSMIDKAKAFHDGMDWGEYDEQAAVRLAHCVAKWQADLEAANARIAQAAELEALRAEKAARDEAHRVAWEAAEQADRGRQEAEQARLARIAADKAEAEHLARIEADKKAAADRAAQEARAAAEAEANRVAKEAADREAALQGQLVEAKAREETAAQAERDRIAEAQRLADMARTKREQDQAHRARITAEIADALRAMAGQATPELIAAALMDGRIPHIKVTL